MATPSGGPPPFLPEGLEGYCPYTLLGLCVSEGVGSPLSVKDAAVDEASVVAREGLTHKAIATAYRRAALRAHPDKHKGKEQQASARFIRVSLAFAFLSDNQKRSLYHNHLRTLLSLRLQREAHRQRWTDDDKRKHKFKEELEKREAAARHGPQRDTEAELLRRIKEENEKLIKERQRDAQEATRKAFRSNSTQQQQHQQQYQQNDGEEGMDNLLLSRSLLFSWRDSPVPATTSTGETAEASLSKTSTTGPIENSSRSSFFAASWLAAQLYSHGASDLSFFSTKRKIACVSFTSRERAIEAALLLQQRRRSSKRSSSSSNSSSNSSSDEALFLRGSNVKLADKAEGFAALWQRVKQAADAAEGETAAAAAAAAAAAEDDDETLSIARDTQQGAALFAAALVAAQGGQSAAAAAADPPTPAAATSPGAAAAAAAAAAPPSAAVGYGDEEGSVFQAPEKQQEAAASAAATAAAETAAAAFGLGPLSGRRAGSCAASRILAYVRGCSERGEAEAQQQQAAAEHEAEWLWAGGSKAAAQMSLEELEAAAFGSLERKKNTKGGGNTATFSVDMPQAAVLHACAFGAAEMKEGKDK
ncbi:hypothetical protein ACSSS7_007769 [Eimeria intestinalis]